MGLNSKLVYLDSCLVIYLVEQHGFFAPPLETYLDEIPDLTLVVSELTVMECLVLPFRNRDDVGLNKFLAWFDQVTVLGLDRETFRKAAQFRADFPGLRTPDALHFALAVLHGCDELLTNDNRMEKITLLQVTNILGG